MLAMKFVASRHTLDRIANPDDDAHGEDDGKQARRVGEKVGRKEGGRGLTRAATR